MAFSDTHQRLIAAQKLLEEGTTSIEKFNSVKKLLKGINPRLDSALNSASDALGRVENIQKGEFLELSAGVLPGETEDEKKRKKAILLFIKSWKDIKSEVARVEAEIHSSEGKSLKEKAGSVSRVAYFAKGAFGLVTLAAVAIVGFKMLSNRNIQEVVKVAPKQKIQVIEFSGKQIPISELVVGTGPDCDADHYHAANGTSVHAVDGSVVPDPGGCGYGRVKETEILEY